MFNFFRKTAEAASQQARAAQDQFIEQALKKPLQLPVNDDAGDKYHQRYYREEAEDQNG